MNQICRDIFRAIHEGKWLKIEYRNKADQITKYWIGIRDLDPAKRTLKVDGLHLGMYTLGEYEKIFVDSILSTEVIEGTYCPENRQLIEDIEMHPERYKTIFSSSANLKILNYLELCNRMDTTPYITDYDLIHYIDGDRVKNGRYALNDQQFQEVVSNFQYSLSHEKKKSINLRIKKLALNVLSIHTAKGLYVLAYRNLNLDVKNRVFQPDEDITVCTQFGIDGQTENARKFLDADEYELLEDFENNLEKIKDAITGHGGQKPVVDDMPYVLGLGMDVVLNLHDEYKAILDMFEKQQVTYPVKAFFGELLERPRRTKAYPIALINQNINLDQLLAINNAMKYPLAYIQGPPGTGKTNTIINTIVTAFFNNTTVLFASYNNVPIDNVFEKLTHLEYHGQTIPFPVLRLGNIDKVKAAISYINRLRNQVQTVKIFMSTLDKRKDDRVDRAKRLSARLKEYEEILDLKERKETLSHLMEYQEHIKNAMNLLPFQMDLQGYQMQKLDQRIHQIGEISDSDALQLLDRNEEEFYQYLFYTSARYIKTLEEPKYQELREILDSGENPETQARAFNKYMQKSENVKKLQRVFPVIITTCISAHKIGEPEPLFDMTIMDEASQCNVAISLVPIIRGEKLMLVGDPQQLNPVILLGELINRKLRRRYHVAEEYDYRKNSIYKTYLACDAVSDEVLLRSHYRCNREIIGFNNKKYYMESQEHSGKALASPFGGGGIAQAMTERARTLKPTLSFLFLSRPEPDRTSRPAPAWCRRPSARRRRHPQRRRRHCPCGRPRRIPRRSARPRSQGWRSRCPRRSWHWPGSGPAQRHRQCLRQLPSGSRSARSWRRNRPERGSRRPQWRPHRRNRLRRRQSCPPDRRWKRSRCRPSPRRPVRSWRRPWWWRCWP